MYLLELFWFAGRNQGLEVEYMTSGHCPWFAPILLNKATSLCSVLEKIAMTVSK